MVDLIRNQSGQLTNKLNFLEKALMQGDQKIADTFSMSLLQTLITGYPYLPVSASSLRPFCLVHILNDIILNERTSIIEFGSGISTIMMGRLIKKNRLKTSVISIEHEEGWVRVLEKLVINEGLDDVIKLVHAPLIKCSLAIDNNRWYDPEILDRQTGSRKFDMVLIDGPPAWEEGKERARYAALPFTRKKVADNFSVYLDDANRKGEQFILQQWKADYGMDFTITGGTLACYNNGHTYTVAAKNY